MATPLITALRNLAEVAREVNRALRVAFPQNPPAPRPRAHGASDEQLRALAELEGTE